MSIAQAFLGELDHEAGNTRKVLERVPDAHVAWKPHAKSYSLGDLALHIANLPTWVGYTLDYPELDLDPPGGAKWPRAEWEGRDKMLATFDKNITDARASIAAASDAKMMEPWTLKKGSTTIFTLPKVAVLRSAVFNHTSHHRGQLTVYLRLKDVPLPNIYGATADETG
jgi:uncharacterized damage-inducible protein DinB